MSYAVSGERWSSFLLGAGEATREVSSVSESVVVLAAPAPRRRVRPEPDDEAIVGCRGVDQASVGGMDG